MKFKPFVMTFLLIFSLIIPNVYGNSTLPLTNIKDIFKNQGGSQAGLDYINKAIISSKLEQKNTSTSIQKLHQDLELVMIQEKFDSKKYIQIRNQINETLLQSLKAKDKIMVNLLDILKFEDRKILVEILKNTPHKN